jgi:hypothetical protein
MQDIGLTQAHQAGYDAGQKDGPNVSGADAINLAEAHAYFYARDNHITLTAHDYIRLVHVYAIGYLDGAASTRN